MKRQQEWLLTQWKVGNNPNVDKTCKYNLNLTSYCHQLSVITASTNSQIPNNSKRNKEVELDRNNSRHQTHFFKIKSSSISIITLSSYKQIQFSQHHLQHFIIFFYSHCWYWHVFYFHFVVLQFGLRGDKEKDGVLWLNV